jgi:TonB family protein
MGASMNALRLGGIAVLLVAACTAATFASSRLFPKPIYSELPAYPERARTAHVAGTVKLWFVLDESGSTAQAKLISGNSILGDAAISTVKSWKFRPEDVHPNIRYETEFVYVLNVQSKSGEPRLTVSMTDFRRVEVVSELYVDAIE